MSVLQPCIHPACWCISLFRASALSCTWFTCDIVSVIPHCVHRWHDDNIKNKLDPHQSHDEEEDAAAGLAVGRPGGGGGGGGVGVGL